MIDRRSKPARSARAGSSVRVLFRADEKTIVRHHAAPRSARGWLSIHAVISSCRQYRRLQR
jgi:hypothetical protein